jgi:tRNA dimethylallyltransferase
MYTEHLNKLLAVVGPTAVGKSDYAVQLAKKVNGEIISADSRQVYKGLDIGTGKITKKEMRGVPHHLLDVVSPKNTYTVSDYKRDAEKVIEDVLSRGKTPIICGGTGFYIQTVVDNIDLPEVPPNEALRKKLEGYSLEKLQATLKDLDPERFKTVDQNNPRRIIRAIEIATAIGRVPPVKKSSRYEVEMIGLTAPTEVLQKRIHSRLLKRAEMGMIKEVENLHLKGLSWKRMGELGLEYRYIARYLQGKLSKEEMITQLEKEIVRYAKRQMTWFKKDKRIKWLTIKN